MSFTSFAVVVLLLNLISHSSVVFGCNKYLVKQTYLGAHNAYHQITTAKTASTEDVGDVYIPIFLYDYKRNIFELLEYGVRGIEIDIYPKGWFTNFPLSFSVQHMRKIDTKSSCDTLTTCLEQVNDFLVAYDENSDNEESLKTVGPILLRIEAKLGIDSYSMDELMEIESIVNTTLDSKYLFTPKDFGAEATQTHWPDWENICLEDMENRVIVVVTSDMINSLYPNAVDPINYVDSMEEQCPMFALCNSFDDKRYCSINFRLIEDDNYLHYASTSTQKGSIFIQPNELSPVDNFNINYETGRVTISETLYNVALAELQNCMSYLTPEQAEYTFGLDSDFTLPLKTWNAFEYIAFSEAYVGNNDTFLSIADLVPSFHMKDISYVNDLFKPLFSTEVECMIEQLAPILKECDFGTIEGHSIFDPILWILLESAFDCLGLNDFVPNVNASAIETRVCDAYVRGYQYVFGDYLFSDGTNTEYTAFTMEDTLKSGGSGCVSSQTFNFRNQ